jgi:hypothetical protein
LHRYASETEIAEVVNRVRWELNPHPGKQLESNIPVMSGEALSGIQHKYKETIHAMLVIWGLYARRIGLVKAIEQVKLKQKTRLWKQFRSVDLGLRIEKPVT